MHVWAVDETNSENRKVKNKKTIKVLVMVVGDQSRDERKKITLNIA